MDFLAGMLFGVGVSGATAMILWSSAIASMDRMVKTLSGLADDYRSRAKYDDADGWKYGRIEGDDE